jgi:cysteinyl-tRNA synthetase
VDLDELGGLYMKAVERAAEVQKKSLDLAARQHADALELCRKALKAAPPLPGMFVLDMAGQVFERLVETEKNIVDLFVEQNAALVETSKQRYGAATQTVAEVSKMVQQSIDRGVALQKSGIEYVAGQTKEMAASIEKQFGLDAAPAAAAAESFRKGIDALFQTQKELLDAATKPLKAAAAGKKG